MDIGKTAQSVMTPGVLNLDMKKSYNIVIRKPGYKTVNVAFSTGFRAKDVGVSFLGNTAVFGWWTFGIGTAVGMAVDAFSGSMSGFKQNGIFLVLERGNGEIYITEKDLQRLWTATGSRGGRSQAPVIDTEPYTEYSSRPRTKYHYGEEEYRRDKAYDSDYRDYGESRATRYEEDDVVVEEEIDWTESDWPEEQYEKPSKRWEDEEYEQKRTGFVEEEKTDWTATDWPDEEYEKEEVTTYLK